MTASGGARIQARLRRFLAWLVRPAGLFVVTSGWLELQDIERARQADSLGRERGKVERLKRRLADMTDARDEAASRIRRLAAALASASGRLQALDAELAERSTERSQLVARIEGLSTAVASRDLALAEYQSSMSELEARIGALLAERESLIGAIDDRDSEIAEQARAVRKREIHLGALFKERKILARALDHERGRLAATKTERDAYRVEASMLAKALGRETSQSATDERRDQAWAAAAARAGLRVRRRAAALDKRPAVDMSRRSPPLGRLSPAWPRLNPAPIARASARTRLPLRLAVVGDARSPFFQFNDPRILARPLGDALVEEADVLVFPRIDREDFRISAGHAPDELWRRARAGKLTLVFDASNEGDPHKISRSVDLHSFLADRGIEASRAVYVTQDRQYRSDYLEWCAAHALQPMGVWVFDAFIDRTLQGFRRTGRVVFEQRLAGFLGRPARRSRRFLSLNFHPRPHKLLFLLRLLRDGLWERGWVSFGGFHSADQGEQHSRARLIEDLLALEAFQDDLDTALPFIDRLDAMGPVLFGLDGARKEGRQRKATLIADELGQYADSWFSVVTESEMSARVHRITEKPLKPLLNFHPFLVLGSPGSLKLLRGYGFETFDGVIDERYDEETDVRRRFDMVYEEVRRLCAADETELAKLSGRLSEIVAFNACWGLTELPGRFADTIASELIDQLAPSAPI